MDSELKRLMQLYDEDYYIHGKTSAWKSGYSEKTMRGVHELLYNWVKRFFPKAKRKLIMGCALGMQVKICREHGDFAVGIDFTNLLGRYKLSKGLVRGSVTHLPFRNGTFDLAVNVNLMEHIPLEHIEQVLREQKRVSRNHFFHIAHEALTHSRCKPTKKASGDITHVTMRPHSFWIELLKIICNAEYHEKTDPPPWNIYIIRC